MSSPSWVPISGGQNCTKNSKKPLALTHLVKGLTPKDPFVHSSNSSNFVPKFFNITFYHGQYTIKGVWNSPWVPCIKTNKKNKHEIFFIFGIFFGVINGKVILEILFYLMSYFEGYNLFNCKKEQQKEKVRNFSVKTFG